ncbi:PREDICTED: pentatricopeptide repeat-containing protein At3g48250, chloroplastic [Fragaria vesca subsp. vesca]|uniref:pentatricopeptide repeat-containing protein At3g48250, chloroplastic n=1 Tax=Fragaria vesca subsp. vesca TaxID=101020 RepID=UPI0002C2FFF4|nr:PREDICTED: pentatricopeptide repeat-containing protein At3g48250, chloroplastic [Fragaria vesca subsp. vesca]
MNRTKAIFTSLRVASSLRLSRAHSTTRPLRSQVTTTHFPHFLSNQSHTSHFLNTRQSLTFSSTPNSVLQLVLSNQWSPELETELSESHLSLTHDVVIYVLKKLNKDPAKAWSFFNWVCEKKGFSPGHSMFSLMLRVLVHKDTMRQFWGVLTRMRDEGFYIDAQTYLSILELLKTGKMDADVSAFKHFYERMIQENAGDEDVKKVMDVVLGAEWSDKVEKELGEIDVELSEKFVVRVLRDLRVCPLKALRFFRWVEQCAGYEHNSVTYNGMSLVLGQASSIGEFWSVIEEMKVAGQELDLDTYIKLSRQFQKSKMVEDAVKLYELMMDGPYKPSVQDVSILLRSISANERPDMDLVFRVVKKFESAGFTLSKAVYDGIHRSLTNLGRFDEAEDTLIAMRNAGFEPDNITYSQVVFGLCKAKKLDEACKLLDDMEENGCVPDIKTWMILIQGHCAANEIDKALICFAKMMEKECKADADILDVLINGLIKQAKVDGAYKLLIEMLNTAHVRPWQATFKNLIQNLLGARKLEEAMELLCLMKKQGYPPYPEPFVGYISKFGSVEDASEFFKALSVKEYPSNAAYVHVFKSFFKEGRHSEAKDLLYKCPHHIRKLGEVRKLFGATERSKTTAIA